jgi:hypothetical protein
MEYDEGEETKETTEASDNHNEHVLRRLQAMNAALSQEKSNISV